MILVEPTRRGGPSATGVLLWCLILLVCIARIVPFSPDMPLAGLDGSWRIGLEQAMAQGLAVGRDMVFTFGPYAAVYTRNYHPATNMLALCASLYLALSYALVLSLFTAGRGKGWLLGLLVMLAGLVYFNDTLLFFLPLLVGLQVFMRWGAPVGSQSRGQRGAPWLLILLFAPFGMLPLIKGTMLVLCLMVAILCCGYLLALRRRVLAVLCVLVPLLTLILLWYASAQPMSALPFYFGRMLAVMSGYNEAMSYYGVVREPLLFVLAAIGLVFAIFRMSALKVAAKIFLILLFSGYLFISFKAGFVRQDGHVVIASTALLLAAVALVMIFPTRGVLLACGFTLLPWAISDHHYMHTSPAGLVGNVRNTLVSAWIGASQRLLLPDWPRSQYDAAMLALKRQAALPVLPGRSDIYAYDQTFLIASGNNWAPRPVMQSYSAYTPVLAELNRAYLLGTAAPDNIFFNVQTIDERFPSLDDGPSWPALLGHYRLSGMHNGIAILKRHAGPDNLTATGVGERRARLGETVRLPSGGPALFAQIGIQSSWPGKIAALLFRPSKLEITVTLEGGAQKKFRMVSSMAEAGFLLSPLVENGTEFAKLYGMENFLSDKRVTSFSVDTTRAYRWFWKPDYRVVFTQLKPKRIDTNPALFSLDRFAQREVQASGPSALRCEGVIDALNNSAAAAPFHARGQLKMNGWLTLHGDRQRIAEQVYVVLTDSVGQHHVVATHRADRPDVAVFFHHAELEAAGYSLNADIAAFQGEYKLGLGYADGKQIRLCPDIVLSGTISK